MALALVTFFFGRARAVAHQIGLRTEIPERPREPEHLQRAEVELERRVAARTEELTHANRTLTTLLKEKDVLLKEIHHRVKNNLQVISSLLNLQASHIQDSAALQIFTESRFRVRSMALIHEKLYRASDVARIDFADYIRSLTSGLLAAFGRKTQVRVAVDIEAQMLTPDTALPCGLIVNELVTNCFKYAFPPDSKGTITISLAPAEGRRFRLRVADDGIGFPKELDFRQTESLGMQIVTILSEQIEGTIELLPGPGTTFEIVFSGAEEENP